MNNDSINAQDKLTKICLLVSMIRGKFVKIEEYNKNTWGIQFSWRGNHSCENKVFVYQIIQSEKDKKVGIQKFCSCWHLWFYVCLFCLWWEKLCRTRSWKIWSFTEMCASCCKAMRWSSWSQKLKSVLWQLVHNAGSPTLL